MKFDVVNIKEEHIAEVKENKKIPKLDWIMTAKYQRDKIISLQSIETDKKTKDDFDQKEFNRFKKEYKKLEGLNNPCLNAEHNKRDTTESLKSNKDKNDVSDKMFVFECNRWLAKDEGDGRIERILKLSKIISSH